MKYFDTTQLSSFPYLGFGAMAITEFYGPAEKHESYKAVEIALENEIYHFDTADDYGRGDNEKFLRTALNLSNSEMRKNILLSTKAGLDRDAYSQHLKGINIKPSYLMGQLSKSLENLGVDYVDIFYIHRLPPNASASELTELAHFLNEIKNKKLVKTIGLSEPRLEQVQLIHDICKIAFIQSEFSILEKYVITRGLLDEYKKLGIHFVAYSPLCRGLLSESFDVKALDADDFRATLPKFTGSNLNNNLQIIEKLKQIAHQKNISLSSLALAYVMQKGLTVLPGLRKGKHVQEAANAIPITLNMAELKLIDEISDPKLVHGSRYASPAMEIFGFE